MASGAIPPSSRMLLILKEASFPGAHAAGFGASLLLSLSSGDGGHWLKLRVSHVKGANALSARLYVHSRLVEYSRLLCQLWPRRQGDGRSRAGGVQFPSSLP